MTRTETLTQHIRLMIHIYQQDQVLLFLDAEILSTLKNDERYFHRNIYDFQQVVGFTVGNLKIAKVQTMSSYSNSPFILSY